MRDQGKNLRGLGRKEETERRPTKFLRAPKWSILFNVQCTVHAAHIIPSCTLVIKNVKTFSRRRLHEKGLILCNDARSRSSPTWPLNCHVAISTFLFQWLGQAQLSWQTILIQLLYTRMYLNCTDVFAPVSSHSCFGEKRDGEKNRSQS